MPRLTQQYQTYQVEWVWNHQEPLMTEEACIEGKHLNHSRRDQELPHLAQRSSIHEVQWDIDQLNRLHCHPH